MIATSTGPSTSGSSTPVTVTVWASSQFDEVNVNSVDDTVTSPVSADETEMTTSETGWVVNSTVNVSVVSVSSTTVDPSLWETDTPGESSSVVVTSTAWLATASYLESAVPMSSTDTVTVESCGPSAIESSTPVIVTVCAVFQLDDVNVIDVGDTVASPVSSEDKTRMTFEVGSESRTTVNVSAEAAPVRVSVTVIDVPDSVNPAVSLSVVATVTAWSASASNTSSLEASKTDTVTVADCVPSSTSSSTAETVTSRGVSQFNGVNVIAVGDTVTSSVSEEVRVMITFEVGSESNTTVNVPVEPVSVATADAFDNVNPAVSSSTVVTDTVWSDSAS